jgi:hypothetical protein
VTKSVDPGAEKTRTIWKLFEFRGSFCQCRIVKKFPGCSRDTCWRSLETENSTPEKRKKDKREKVQKKYTMLYFMEMSVNGKQFQCRGISRTNSCADCRLFRHPLARAIFAACEKVGERGSENGGPFFRTFFIFISGKICHLLLKLVPGCAVSDGVSRNN